MGRIDKDVRLEVLSALTGAHVRPYTTHRGRRKSNDLNIYNFVTSSLTNQANVPLRLAGLGHSGDQDELFVDMDELFDPDYDYDFSHCRDRSECWRGHERYMRPLGWYRIALRVLDKYPDGNEWLGTAGWRNCSVYGEWPVSYHGTSIEGVKGILTSHYKAGPREVYGRGIYSTHDIYEASDYCTEFKSKTNGKTYRVLMQNRINPRKRTVCSKSDYWLIEIPKGSSPEEEREIVEKSIRPYGILLKEVPYR